jgi:hypothetical protein
MELSILIVGMAIAAPLWFIVFELKKTNKK